MRVHFIVICCVALFGKPLVTLCVNKYFTNLVGLILVNILHCNCRESLTKCLGKIIFLFSCLFVISLSPFIDFSAPGHSPYIWAALANQSLKEGAAKNRLKTIIIFTYT